MVRCAFEAKFTTQWRCPEEALPGSRYCIMHDSNTMSSPQYWEIFCEKLSQILKDSSSLEIHLEGFKFGDYANKFLAGSKFDKPVYFDQAVFGGALTNFRNTVFLNKASFWHVNVYNSIDFSKAEFHDEANFQQAKLGVILQRSEPVKMDLEYKGNGHVSFEQAMFKGPAIFRGALFGGVNCGGCHFAGPAVFKDSRFLGQASFIGAIFCGRTNFNEVVFEKLTIFDGVHSMRPADFRFVRFQGQVYFQLTQFHHNVNFYGARFVEPAIFSGGAYTEVFSSKKKASFRGIKVVKSEGLKFEDVNLSRCSFLYSDLRNIEFKAVRWDTQKHFLGLIRRPALYDERKHGHKPGLLPDLEKLYRQLKETHEQRGSRHDACDFHYGELEMRRRSLGKWRARFSLLNLYRLLSGYGNYYSQAAIMFCFMWVILAMLFMLTGFEDPAYKGIHIGRNWETWQDFARNLSQSLIYSFQVMILQKFDLTFNSWWGELWKALAAVSGPLQIALFGLALRKRFR